MYRSLLYAHAAVTYILRSLLCGWHVLRSLLCVLVDHGCVLRWLECVQIIAMCSGHCYAGGALLALASDLRVMNSQRGWLCFNEVFINRRFGAFNIQFLK